MLTQLRHLSCAVAVMEPDADRSLLNLAISRLTPLAQPVRNKASRLVSPVALLQLGQKLMAGGRRALRTTRASTRWTTATAS